MKKCTFIGSSYLNNLQKLILFLVIFVFYNCTYKNLSQEEITKNNITKIRWNHKTIDFGKVSNDTLIEANFRLYNNDTLPLIIKYVNPECGCTNFKISKKIILAQDSCEISLFLNTKNKKGYQRIITTVCTNSKQKFSKLTLKGFVK